MEDIEPAPLMAARLLIAAVLTGYLVASTGLGVALAELRTAWRRYSCSARSTRPFPSG